MLNAHFCKQTAWFLLGNFLSRTGAGPVALEQFLHRPAGGGRHEMPCSRQRHGHDLVVYGFRSGVWGPFFSNTLEGKTTCRFFEKPETITQQMLKKIDQIWINITSLHYYLSHFTSASIDFCPNLVKQPFSQMELQAICPKSSSFNKSRAAWPCWVLPACSWVSCWWPCPAGTMPMQSVPWRMGSTACGAWIRPKPRRALRAFCSSFCSCLTVGFPVLSSPFRDWRKQKSWLTISNWLVCHIAFSPFWSKSAEDVFRSMCMFLVLSSGSHVAYVLHMVHYDAVYVC